MTAVLDAPLPLAQRSAAVLGGAARRALRQPLKVCAGVAMTCCSAMLPICLDAVFGTLSPEQRERLATTIVTELAAAAQRNQPTPSNREGDLTTSTQSIPTTAEITAPDAIAVGGGVDLMLPPSPPQLSNPFGSEHTAENTTTVGENPRP